MSPSVIFGSTACWRAPHMAAASSSDGSMLRSRGTSIRKAVGTMRRPSMKIMPVSE